MLKITRLNRSGKQVECVIELANVDGLTEKLVEPTRLFDEDGNLVQEQENESIFQVHFTNGREIYITKETYEKLIDKLQVETL